MKNKGISSLFDVMIYAFILVLAFTVIQLYSMSHQATSIKNLKYEAENQYAAQTLESLSYLTIDGDGYQTVQADTLEPVEDEDLKNLTEKGEQIRAYADELDSRLNNWSKNLTELKEGIQGNITEIQDTLSDTTDMIDYTSQEIQNLSTTCSEVVTDINLYGQLIGGIALDNSSCSQVENLTTQIVNASSQVEEKISKANDTLQTVKEAIKQLRRRSPAGKHTAGPLPAKGGRRKTGQLPKLRRTRSKRERNPDRPAPGAGKDADRTPDHDSRRITVRRRPPGAVRLSARGRGDGRQNRTARHKPVR